MSELPPERGPRPLPPGWWNSPPPPPQPAPADEPGDDQADDDGGRGGREDRPASGRRRTRPTGPGPLVLEDTDFSGVGGHVTPGRPGALPPPRRSKFHPSDHTCPICRSPTRRATERQQQPDGREILVTIYRCTGRHKHETETTAPTL